MVRYFGGTLLGVGGLIQAYKNAAGAAIENSVIEEKFILFEYEIEFSFDDMNYLMKILKDCECKLISQNYGEINSITFLVKKQLSDKFQGLISSLYKTKLSYIRTL